MNVPGKKNRVATVMTFIETVSIFVFRAISFISVVIEIIFFVEILLISVL